ncbi:MAG TPA: peptidylprolyl isomerase [Planococcus sp. (in: firmicutes)]|nr:peptidylprolyl isomerase [Planococcus sp. (in: firmicutes)]
MKKKISIIIGLTLFLAACNAGEETVDSGSVAEGTGEYPQLTEEVASNEALVDLNTSMGTIGIKLFPEHAPKAVENFLALAEEGYYEGIIFHRVIEDFMIQSGDPTGTGGGGESTFGEPFEDEFTDELYNFRGALSMANAGPGTNGSQFFIVQADAVPADRLPADYPEEVISAYEEMGGTPWLDGGHTVFGQVVKGMDIVDEIAAAKKQQDKPVEDITIESIEILQQP